MDHRYEGWDPYDGINGGKLSMWRWGRPYLQMGLVQLHKLSPINLREKLGVQKGISTKGLAIFVRGYLTLYAATGREEYLREASRLSEMIVDSSLVEKYGEHAWASHYFTYYSMDGGSTGPGSFDLIGTCNVLKALSMLHQITRDGRLEEIVGSCQAFMQGLIERRGDLAYFRYAPRDKGKMLPNASAEALGAIALSLRSRWNEELHTRCGEVLRSLLRLQREDGSWGYSYYPGGMVYDQLDFHQGYVIGGLLSYRDLVPMEARAELDQAIAAATGLYGSMFREDGRSFYHAPRKYPTEVHNQAQGIITFAQLAEVYYNRSYLRTAHRIASWTIANMQDEDGHFYYWKGRLITNRIPYMRWGQAWMFLALASLHAQESRIGGPRSLWERRGEDAPSEELSYLRLT